MGRLVLGDDALDHIDRADKAGDKFGIGKFVDIDGLSDHGDLALIHHPDAGGQAHRLFLVMSDDDKGDAQRLLDLDQFELGFLAQLLDQCAERLVEQQLGPLGESLGQSDALTLPPES